MSLAARRIPTDPDGFIAWENRQRPKYELVDGVVRLMAGGTVAHNRVAMNLANALMNALLGGACEVHASDVKVRSPLGTVTYPDVFVRCGPVDPQATDVDDPVVVIEVFSPSTRKEDIGAKRFAYQSIPTIQHLVFVSPDQVLIELVTRAGEDRWLSTVHRRIDRTLELEAIGVSVPLVEVYRGVLEQT